MLRRLTLATAFVSALAALQACSSPQRDTTWRAPRSAIGAHSIGELLDVVAASKAKFEYLVDTEMHVETGPEMAATLRGKYQKSGAPEMSPPEFVERFATHSDSEGATYYVRLPDGKRVTLASWLEKQIAR